MPRGRKPKNPNQSVTKKPINIQLPIEEYDLFKYIADKEGKSMSELARECFQPVIDRAKDERYKDMEEELNKLRQQLKEQNKSN